MSEYRKLLNTLQILGMTHVSQTMTLRCLSFSGGSTRGLTGASAPIKMCVRETSQSIERVEQLKRETQSCLYDFNLKQN